MPERFVRVDRRDDGVALVTLDRPKMNAMSLELLGQLSEAAAQLTAEPPGAVVVWGGQRIFAAGADIAEFTRLRGRADAGRLARTFHGALDAFAAVPRMTIAAVCGYALGGGCELALACDLRVAAEDAKIGQPEILLGIIPGGGGTQRLARLVGPARAKELIATGRQVTAGEALGMGLVDRVVPAEQVLGSALDTAAGLASGAVVAQGLAKRAVDGGLASASLEEGMALEREMFAEVFETEDARAGVESFLRQGPGKARFSGR